jgi:hypothetical protein
MRKGRLSRLMRWCVLGLALLAMNATAVGWVVVSTSWTWRRLPIAWWRQVSIQINFNPRASISSVDWCADGQTGRLVAVVIEQPGAPAELGRLWGPVAVSSVVTLMILAIAPTRAGRRLMRRMRMPRLTMLQGMAAIGAVSVLLWLGRVHVGVALIAALVLALMAHAAWRRGHLAKEISSEGTSASRLSRVGLAGYSLAALLAVAWLIAIFIWDLLMQRA